MRLSGVFLRRVFASIFCAFLAFECNQTSYHLHSNTHFTSILNAFVTHQCAFTTHLHLSSPPYTNAHSCAFPRVRSYVAGPCALKAHSCILHSCAFMCILMHHAFLVHSCALEHHRCALGSLVHLLVQRGRGRRARRMGARLFAFKPHC